MATTSPSSSGPTTSWMAVIRSYRVMGRRDDLASPAYPCPRVSPCDGPSRSPCRVLLRCLGTAARAAIAHPVLWDGVQGHVCGMIRPPEAAIGPSGCVVDIKKDRVYAVENVEDRLKIAEDSLKIAATPHASRGRLWGASSQGLAAGSARMLYSFDDYTLDAEHYELRQAGRLVRLEPQVFNVLAYLVQHPGRTVTKEELEEQLWPDSQLVGESSLANAVAQVRKALADTGQGQRYIQTVHRRGYRFVAPVTARPPGVADLPAAPAPDTPQPPATSLLDQANAVAPPTLVPRVTVRCPCQCPYPSHCRRQPRPMRRALPRVGRPKTSGGR